MLIIGVILAGLVAAAGYFFARSISQPLAAIEKAADAVANGNLQQKIEVDSQDEIGVVANAFRKVIDTLERMRNEVNGLIESISDGRLDARGQAEAFAGDYREMVIGINNLIDEFMRPFNMTAEYVDRISKGEIPAPITDEYRGDFNEIKNNVNAMIENLTRFAGDVQTAGSEVSTGSSEVSKAAQKMSQGASEQAASIEEIARQTNMLALNAAIEAARAGLHAWGDQPPRKRRSDHRSAHDAGHERHSAGDRHVHRDC